MKKTIELELDFEILKIKQLEDLISDIKKQGSTHLKVTYHKDKNPYMQFYKDEIVKDEVEYILNNDMIHILHSHGIKINKKIFNEELFEYQIVDREDFINELFRWIAEANQDKELMKDDLMELSTWDDEYIFSSISTNKYIGKDSAEFNETCEALIELNENL